MSTQRDKTISLQTVLVVFFLVLNVIVTAYTASPFWIGVILSEIPLIAMFVSQLRCMHLYKLCIGMFLTYCATCCFVIGCKFYFHSNGLGMSTEYVVVAYGIALVGFFTFHAIFVLTRRWTVPMHEWIAKPTADELDAGGFQFTTRRLFFATTAAAILITVFRASWPTDDNPNQSIYPNGIRLFSQKLLPFIVLPPFITALLLNSQRRIQLWAFIAILLAFVATTFYQATLMQSVWRSQIWANQDPFEFSSLVHSLSLDTGYFVSLAIVCVLFRIVNSQTQQVFAVTSNSDTR